MKIDRVTITGADDSTDIDWMLDLSKQFPFVEWGILVSQRKEGSPRFPSREWIVRLVEQCWQNPPRLSVHVCGRWVREICSGEWRSLWVAHDDLMRIAKRVQLNFHADRHNLKVTFYEGAKQYGYDHQLIFQFDDINNNLMDGIRSRDIDAVPLFDRSGGIGVVPDQWPVQSEGVYSGYAGGLGPHNLEAELERINRAALPDGRIWIDMETRVRTDDDQQLNKEAVESVLVQMAESAFLSKPA